MGRLFPLLIFTTIIIGCTIAYDSSILYVEDDEPIVKEIPPDSSRDGRESAEEGIIITDIAKKLLRLSVKSNSNDTITPSEVSTTTIQPSNLTNDQVLLKQSARISYTGAQVWKFRLNNLQVLSELNELNAQKEIGWWGGNISYIDMMVKPTSIQVAHNILTSYKVPYEIIIPDLQVAIDNENPIYDEEAELANRKAKRIMSWQNLRFGALMGLNSYDTDMKMWPTAYWGTSPIAYRWGGKGNSKNPCAETYGGRSAFSEPESRAIKHFFEKSGGSIKAYVSFHSYGQFILYPWGYENVVPPDYRDLQHVGQKMAQAMRKAGGGAYKVGSSANTLYPASGGSDDWAKAYGVKYSYTVELRDSGRHGFVLPASLITVTAKEALAAVRVVAAAVTVST